MADGTENTTTSTTTTTATPEGGAGTTTSAPATGRGALQAAQARIAELERQVGEWAPKVGAYDSLQSQFDQARQEWSQKEAGWGTERSLLSSGINDAEDTEIVTLFYGKVQPDEKGAKPGLSDWLADRENLPRAVREILERVGKGATPTTTAPANKNTTTVTAPNPNKGATGNGAPGTGTFNAQSLGAMSTDAYKQNREAILAALGKR